MLKRGIQFLLRPLGLKLARIRPDEQVVAPFDVLEHVVFKAAREAGDGFRFVQFGPAGKSMADRLTPLVAKYRIRGDVIDSDALEGSFSQACARSSSRPPDLLYLDTERHGDRILQEALERGIFPSIISYASASLPPERGHDLKLALLDHGYRFIDVGGSTICVRQDGRP